MIDNSAMVQWVRPSDQMLLAQLLYVPALHELWIRDTATAFEVRYLPFDGSRTLHNNLKVPT